MTLNKKKLLGPYFKLINKSANLSQNQKPIQSEPDSLMFSTLSGC